MVFKLLKILLAPIMIVKMTRDRHLRWIAIIMVVRMARRIAVPCLILGTLMMFATTKARGEADDY